MKAHLSHILIQTADVSAVEVEASIGGQKFKVTGSAKKHPNDRPDLQIGATLAYARALRQLVSLLESDAEHRVVVADRRRQSIKRLEKAFEYLDVPLSVKERAMSSLILSGRRDS